VKPITVWNRFNSDSQEWDFNHIESGHVETLKPVGDDNQTNNWSKGTWAREYKYLNQARVVVDAA